VRCLTQHDPIGIPAGDIVLNDVVRVSAQQTDAKVPPLSCVAVSDKPVRTEPVAAGTAIQSYAAAGKSTVSISYGKVASKVVTGPAADQNAGGAIGGQAHVPHRNVGTVTQPDTCVPKPLNQAGAMNGHVCLPNHVDPVLDGWRREG